MTAGLQEEIVCVVVDGHALFNWQEVNVSRSMENAALSFGMKATNPAWTSEAKAFRTAKQIEIRTAPTMSGGGDLVLTGSCDSYESEIGEGANREVRISGRSKTKALIDSPAAKHKTGRVENKTLEDAATEFGEGLGVKITSDVKLDKIAKLQAVPGESVFQTLERKARRLGVMLEGQPDGSLKITRGKRDKRHAGAFVEGHSPVTKWSIQIRQDGKRSDVIVRGQKAVGVGRDKTRQEVKEFDPNVGEYRPIILFNEGDDDEKDLKRRAEWERLRRSAAAVTVSVTVSRWRDEAGLLWTPGHLIAVSVPSEDLDMDLMLKSVNYKQDIKDGTRAELVLVDPKTMGAKGGKGGKQDKSMDPGEELSE